MNKNYKWFHGSYSSAVKTMKYAQAQVVRNDTFQHVGQTIPYIPTYQKHPTHQT